jgi:APA family basic amino acid/polyamine antiporter
MESHKQENYSGFRVPYINGRILMPLLCITSLFFFIVYDKGESFNVFSVTNLPVIAFWILFVVLAVLTFLKRFSLIPVLGMLTNFYLMTQLNYTNWLAFLVWLALGMVVYMLYGKNNSKLNAAIPK